MKSRSFVSEGERPRGQLFRVFVWLLVALIAGVGWLAIHGPSHWHMIGGVVLVASAIGLSRVAQDGG
jgi:hypothetical protein